MNPDLSPPSVGLNKDALARLGASIQADIDSGKHFGASILVARHGQVAYQATFGTVAPGRAPSGDDRYLLMSMSKAYTHAADGQRELLHRHVERYRQGGIQNTVHFHSICGQRHQGRYRPRPPGVPSVCCYDNGCCRLLDALLARFVGLVEETQQLCMAIGHSIDVAGGFRRC